MPTTSNFGWTTPADTDLVKNGALAIRTLGNGIDTSLLDLKGGTTGQILSKASNTDLDYTWINNDQGDITEVQAGTGISVASGTGPIPVVTNTVATAFDAKGDLIAGTGADTFSKLTVGTNGQYLVADSATATGLKWASLAAATYVGTSCTKSTDQNISTNTFTAVTFNGEEFDTDSFHSTSTNTSRITIPSGKAGKYLINATLVWDGNATSVRRGDLYKNGALARVGTITNNTGVANQCVFSILTVLDLAVNDYIELFAYQESGSTVAVRGYTGATSFQATYLGA